MNSTHPNLDAIFGALADPTRRAILTRLTQGPASVGALVEPLTISQPAVSRHLKVLEQAGLIERETNRQTRLAKISAAPMGDAAAWLKEFEAFWTGRFGQLDGLLAQLKSEETK